MAKDVETKEKFIELRAKGYSYQRIAQEIDVSKTTLIKWGLELDKQIQNRVYLNTQELLEQLELTSHAKIERLAQVVKRVQDEMSRRDLSEIPMKELHALEKSYSAEFNKYIQSMKYFTGETYPVDYSLLDQFMEEKTLDLT